MTYRSRSGGPGKTHKKQPRKPDQPRKLHHPPASTSTAQPESSSHPALSYPTEEDILDTLRDALQTTLASPDFRSTIQRIKGLLYDAKWLEVFTDATLLEAYAGRWVPSRALCFRELMVHLKEVREMVLGADEDEEGETSNDGDEGESSEGEEGGDVDEDVEVDTAAPLQVISLGGGASSELLALASLLGYSRNRKGKERACEFIGADIGAWSSVLDKIGSSSRSRFGLTSLHISYVEGDLLLPEPSVLRYLPPAGSSSPILVTLLFTLTELLSQSPVKTINLLREISSRLPSGSLLLVADSASDIASFSLGAERKWPTFTIIDLVMLRLLRQGDAATSRNWELLEGEDSRWFRLGEGVGANWPVKVENARYWYRLFRLT